MSQRGGAHESSLLLTLEEISQLVSQCHDPSETLGNIVRLIQGRFHTDVCSVYLLEPDRGELVLGATIGLKPECVGRVRMRLEEGLTGLAAQQMAPVMVEDAFQHPRFKYFPEAGEDPYHSFLGVPLVEGGTVQGVLVVQTAEPRTFSADETRTLVAVAAQLAPLVSEARLLERICAAQPEPAAPGPAPAATTPSTTLRGTPLSAGVGLGEAYIVNGFETWRRAQPAAGADPAEQQRRLSAARDAAREEIIRLSHRISELVGEDHGAILQAQLMILQDRKIERDLTAWLATGVAAESAVIQAMEKYVAAFQKLETAFFQERVYDIQDVFRRVLWHLQPHETPGAGTRLVLIARDVSVMDLFSVNLDDLAGVVAAHGGPQSHAAILARSLGVPMVGQVADVVARVEPGRTVLVDGTAGAVYVNPTSELIARHARPATAAGVFAPAGAPAAPAAPAAAPLTPRAAAEPSRPGLPRVEANVNLLAEVPRAVEQGAAGVGLYRTEFLFLARRTLPTEDEQVGTYRKLLLRLAGRPASIRTFDLRPDKLAHHDHLSSMAAGPLDWRRVLDSPPLQKLFRDQVRAILRAATAGPARILVPLVTRTEQLDFVLQTVAEAREELARDGLEFRSDVPLGIMLEVAAAAAMAASWAAQVAFFAIGTNDLLASALGIDRDDPAVASLNDPLHPGLLRTIRDVVRAAHDAGRPVTVCGEMAADPDGILALQALGIDSLSVPVGQIRPVRAAILDLPADTAARYAAELPDLRTAAQAREVLRRMRSV